MTTWRPSPWPADLDRCAAWIAHLTARCRRRQPSFANASRRTEPSMSLFNVGFVIFPELTQLDFTGPQQVLARLPHSAMHIIAKSAAPVSSDSGLSLLPTHTFENCPRLDLICIPGGSSGVVRAMGDRNTIEFVQRQSVTAKYVTSVCTGAFILGAAGLLNAQQKTGSDRRPGRQDRASHRNPGCR